MSERGFIDDFTASRKMVRQKHLDQMRAWEVSPQSQIMAGLWGITRIAAKPTAPLFTVAEDGAEAIVLPIYDAPGSGGDYSRCLPRQIIDLVAFHADDPSRFWCHTDYAWALGADQINIAIWWPDGPLQVHRTPLDWLRASGKGVCVLDFSANGYRRLGHVPWLATSDRNHAVKLRKWIAPGTPPMPRISYEDQKEAT